MAGYIGGKRGCMGVRSGSRGAAPGGRAGGEAPAGGLAEHWLNKSFLLLGFVPFSAIQTRNSSKIFL